jgi:hypothetical protein
MKAGCKITYPVFPFRIADFSTENIGVFQLILFARIFSRRADGKFAPEFVVK